MEFPANQPVTVTAEAPIWQHFTTYLQAVAGFLYVLPIDWTTLSKTDFDPWKIVQFAVYAVIYFGLKKVPQTVEKTIVPNPIDKRDDIYHGG